LAFVDTDNLGVRLLHNVYTVAIWDMTPRRAVHQGTTGFLFLYGNVQQIPCVREILHSVADRSRTRAVPVSTFPDHTAAITAATQAQVSKPYAEWML